MLGRFATPAQARPREPAPVLWSDRSQDAGLGSTPERGNLHPERGNDNLPPSVETYTPSVETYTDENRNGRMASPSGCRKTGRP